MRKIKRPVYLLIAMLGFTLLVAANRSQAQPLLQGAAVSVSMKDFQFDPKPITIKAGDSITWKNDGTKKHTATADDGSFDTAVVAPGTSSQPVKFDKPGTYAYYCQFHGGPGGVDMASTIIVEAADGGQAAQATAAPAAAAAAPIGAVTFADKAKEAHADSLTVAITNMPLPPEEQQYEFWLANGTAAPVSLGVLSVKADGTAGLAFANPKGANLIGLYNIALITVQNGDLTTPGQIAFSGAIPPLADIHVRHLDAAFPTTPDQIGLLDGAIEQEAVLTQHVAFMNDALKKGDVALAKLHLEHIHNLMTGNNGAKDLNADGKLAVIPPGDGFGIFNYLATASQHADLAAQQPDANGNIKVKANHVKITAANATGWLSQIQALALQAAAKKTVADIKPLADQITALNNFVTKGKPDASGGVSPTKDSGGITTAYAEGLAMATISLLPGDAAFKAATSGGQPAAQPTTVSQPVATQEATTVSQPIATAEATTAAASSVTITMKDFEFDGKTVTIKAGQSVVFTNAGTKKHTGTADDNSFDTGVVAPGTSSQPVKFDKPGTYPFYCQFHGGPGGVDMSGTIVVQ